MFRCMNLSKFYRVNYFVLFGCFNNFKLALTFVEKGEVISEHYKLLPVDLRDIPKLDDIISLANIDPRYACEVLITIVCFFIVDDIGHLHSLYTSLKLIYVILLAVALFHFFKCAIV